MEWSKKQSHASVPLRLLYFTVSDVQMQPKFHQNKKKIKSLLSILDTMEWSKKQSHATVPLNAAFPHRL